MDKEIIDLLVYLQDFNETDLEDKYMKFPIRWEIKKNVLAIVWKNKKNEIDLRIYLEDNRLNEVELLNRLTEVKNNLSENGR